jgi:putative glutamine amidotransferase
MQVALPFGTDTPEEKRGKYRAALRMAGLEPVEDRTSLDGLTGLMLAGGNDVAPALYGAEPHPKTDPPNPDRDQLEIALLQEALTRNLPVLAICRGIQLLNVALGGTLHQHIEGHHIPKQKDVHPVQIAPGSLLHGVLGASEYSVNSLHHQAIDRLAPRAQATATSPDGIVEAIELPDSRFVLAVQWHPEARTGGKDLLLFEAFAKAVRRR